MICLIVFIISAKGYIQSQDTGYSIQTAQAIASHRQLNIQYSAGNTLIGRDGKSYSKWGTGLAFYYLPWVAAATGLSHITRLPDYEVIGLLISFANIPFAIFAMIYFRKLLKLLAVKRIYFWLLPLWLALGTLAWPYAVDDLSEEMQMCLLIITVYCVVRSTAKSAIAGGMSYAWLILVKLVYAAFIPLFLIYLLMQPGRLRPRIDKIALFTLPITAAFCLTAWLNFVRFGNPLESGYGGEAHQFFALQLWHTVPKLLGSLDKGLFIFCPVLILGLLGWKGFIIRHRHEAALCGGLLIGSLLLFGAWYGWSGGWCWGPRFLVPEIPLWLLPIAFWSTRWLTQARRLALVVLTLIIIALQIPGVLVVCLTQMIV